MKKTYLAFTIGPITRTLVRAKKTRDLWAASFIFSLLMKELLHELAHKPGYRLLHPFYSDELAAEKRYGAGTWPDWCVVVIEKAVSPDVEVLLQPVLQRISGILKVSAADIRPLFQIYAAKSDWTDEDIEKMGVSAVQRLKKLLDNLETRAVYQHEEDQTLNGIIEDNIYDLYEEGFDEKPGVFIDLGDYGIRLPSLPEIGARDFRITNPEIYDDYFENVVNEQVIAYRKTDNRRKKDGGDTEKENEKIFQELPKEVKKLLKLRHKYIAIVKADGDNLSKTIEALKKAGDVSGETTGFSEKLMPFSRDAVKKIVDYGGLPVYAGGDDLLFIAPVASGVAAMPDIFTLCSQLSDLFQSGFEKEKPTLSFGVSISYYKHPLGEALASAGKLLDQAKEFYILNEKVVDPIPKKHALAFQVQKHSGQRFGATLWMGGQGFKNWLELLDIDQNPNEAFLSGVMHKLESLISLLADACNRKTLEAFRDHHFNEGSHTDSAYLKKALQLAQVIFEEYGEVLKPAHEADLEENYNLADRNIQPIDFYKINILYAALRIKQFLIQPDHD